MSKITLESVASGYDLSKINANFVAIAAALNDEVLYRDNPIGEVNTLITNIDVNGRSLYNLPEPTLAHQAATKDYVDTSPTSAAAGAQASAAAALVSEINAAASEASAAASALEVADQKIVWKGAWSGATAYAVNDAASSSGTSYICIAAHTNQTPPNASYWEVLAAKGAAGAGTGDMLAANNLSDVDDASTARTNLGLQIGANVQAYDAALLSLASLSLVEGDVIYATAADTYARLPKGTASQLIRMNSGATAPEWFTPTTTGITLGTKQVGSETAENAFTSLPAGIKRISLNFNSLSTNGTSIIVVQPGDSGGYKTTGFTGCIETANSRYVHSDGFKLVGVGSTSWSLGGRIILELIDVASFIWSATIFSTNAAGDAFYHGAGNVTLNGELDRIRVTTQGGVDTIDAASILNILYE